MNVTTVWQSDGHCLTFCFQRFEFTENGSRSTESHVMSALGQKQTLAAHKAMSALPPKADMCSAQADIR